MDVTYWDCLMQKFVYKKNGRNKVIIGRTSEINIESSLCFCFFNFFVFKTRWSLSVDETTPYRYNFSFRIPYVRNSCKQQVGKVEAESSIRPGRDSRSWINYFVCMNTFWIEYIEWIPLPNIVQNKKRK